MFLTVQIGLLTSRHFWGHSWGNGEGNSPITLAFPDDDSTPRKPVVAEFLAEVGAMELLFPYGARVKILAANPRPNFLEVAKQYMIPKAHAEKYLGTAYMKQLGRFSRI